MISLLIAEDQAMVRGALVALLGLEDDFRVLGTVTRVLKKGSDLLREVITEDGS